MLATPEKLHEVIGVLAHLIVAFCNKYISEKSATYALNLHNVIYQSILIKLGKQSG